MPGCVEWLSRWMSMASFPAGSRPARQGAGWDFPAHQPLNCVGKSNPRRPVDLVWKNTESRVKEHELCPCLPMRLYKSIHISATANGRNRKGMHHTLVQPLPGLILQPIPTLRPSFIFLYICLSLCFFSLSLPELCLAARPPTPQEISVISSTDSWSLPNPGISAQLSLLLYHLNTRTGCLWILWLLSLWGGLPFSSYSSFVKPFKVHSACPYLLCHHTQASQALSEVGNMNRSENSHFTQRKTDSGKECVYRRGTGDGSHISWCEIQCFSSCTLSSCLLIQTADPPVTNTALQPLPEGTNEALAFSELSAHLLI